MVFVDTHVHLNDPAFADDLETVVARARAAGVGRMVVAGYDRASSERAVVLADRPLRATLELKDGDQVTIQIQEGLA